jgi:urea transport system ATP-binding protein
VSEALVVEGLTVDFDGFKANELVDVTFEPGRLHFLIGPNGAGKTTLVDALTGLVRASGSAMYAGVNLLDLKSHQVVRAGVGRTFQTATVFEELTVVQNLDIAGGLHRKPWQMALARKGVPENVESVMETIGLGGVAHFPAGRLAHGEKQWLEIGMLLVQDAKVMFLDETVAGMSAEEREETGALLRKISPHATIVVIEHDMDFVRTFADIVTVLHAGKVLAEGSVAEIQANSEVQEIYLGRSVEAVVGGAVDE